MQAPRPPPPILPEPCCCPGPLSSCTRRRGRESEFLAVCRVDTGRLAQDPSGRVGQGGCHTPRCCPCCPWCLLCHRPATPDPECVSPALSGPRGAWPGGPPCSRAGGQPGAHGHRARTLRSGPPSSPVTQALQLGVGSLRPRGWGTLAPPVPSGLVRGAPASPCTQWQPGNLQRGQGCLPAGRKQCGPEGGWGSAWDLCPKRRSGEALAEPWSRSGDQLPRP